MNKLFTQVTRPVPKPAPGARTRRMFVRDMVLDALVGVYAHEKTRPQRIRVTIDAEVWETPNLHDRLDDVVSYEDFVIGVRQIVASGHINLLETLAERIADRCLGDTRVRRVVVRVEKLDVFEDAASVGIEIERTNG